MAYGPATGTVVLFGGASTTSHTLRGTWVWNGTTWAKQAPATKPPARLLASMAGDAATGNVVLFGGSQLDGPLLRGTWVWDGTTWTQQAPATSPPALWGAPMTYDAATRSLVRFGGAGSHGLQLRGTWVWNGTAWTKRTPATSPPARFAASMAYDAATGNVVLFGGAGGGHVLNDTWVWALASQPIRPHHLCPKVDHVTVTGQNRRPLRPERVQRLGRSRIPLQHSAMRFRGRCS